MNNFFTTTGKLYEIDGMKRTPRTLRDAFPDAREPIVLHTEHGWWDTVQEFVEVYRLYRISHGRWYAARIAWNIAVNGSAF
jgi:hypothetical protein